MALFRRPERLPETQRAQLPDGERVLSWADAAADGSVVVTSPLGIWWPEPDGLRLIGWQYVSKATWHDGQLTVVQGDVVDDLLITDRPAETCGLRVPRDLPATVRKRVEANVVHSELQPVPGGTARFVARRTPGADGLTWWARLEAGTPDTPAARAEIGARLTLLRADWEARNIPD